MKRLLISALLGMALISTTARAVNLSLTPGTFGLAPGDGGPKGGVLVASLTSGPTQDQPDLRFTARVFSEVYAGDPLNGLGGLTFWYQIENVIDPATEGRVLQGLGIPLDFPTSVIEVNSEGGANTPDLAGLTASGSEISFVWLTDTVEVGSLSSWLVIYTDYDAYREALVGVADGTVEDVAALVPTRTAVPDSASTAWLLVLGLAGIAICGKLRDRCSG
jgi:hypothetical protein